MAAENVHALFTPDADAMREHLDHMFGGYLDGYHDGRIELAWTDTKPGPDGRYALRHARMYGTDEIEELVAEAVRLNSQPMCNVYIGAALRKPGTFPGGRSDDKDVLALTCGYVDLDDDGAAIAAKDKYGTAKPSKVVVTGKEPYTRAQMWWRLDEPITDFGLSEALLKAMAGALGGDSSVTNPSRVMRLAGTIAWPMKPDRKRPELTFIAPLREPGQPVYTVEHLSRLFPPAQTAAGDDIQFTQTDGVSRGANAFGLGDKVEDGRERYMVKTINACLIQLVGESGRAPGAQELFDASWPQYARNTDFSRPGRGQTEFGRKVVYTLKRFAEGKIRGCETIEKVKNLYRQREHAHSAGGGKGKYHDYSGSDEFSKAPKIDPETGDPLPLILTAEEFLRGFNPPDYLVDGMLQKSYLVSLTARTGHGKTAVAMLLGVAVARGLPFHGRPTEQGGVLFLAGENPDDIRARYLALASHENFDPHSIPFHFVDGVIDIKASLPRIREEAAKVVNLSMIIVDTQAAYFLGDEGNSNEQQGWFARLLRELIKMPGKPLVLVNCHPVKNASQDNLIPMGGSAFLNEVDANLTLWADDKTCTLGPHQDKWRGVTFESVSFELRTVTSDRLKDTKGRPMPSVIAVPITEAGAERRAAVAEEDDKTVLRLLHAEKNASLNTVARNAGWFWPDGSPARNRVQRMVDRMCRDRLLYKIHGGKYRLKKAACKLIGVKWEREDDEE
jgi:hypothetical protein